VLGAPVVGYMRDECPTPTPWSLHVGPHFDMGTATAIHHEANQGYPEPIPRYRGGAIIAPAAVW
jgi:hypothetical protein